MKTYQLISAWQGMEAGTRLFGVYALAGSLNGCYVTKENIPADGGMVQTGFFKSAIENNPLLFSEVTQEKAPA
jgi:hypothetical protein